jgi:RimJ/RimL family protein N-acetyltransferase
MRWEKTAGSGGAEARPLLPEADLKRARRIIQATTHADTPPAEAARVCDLDLWRLAAPWDDFQRHALGIRHEYLPRHADEAAFWKARHAFYEAMLAKPRLFATDTFRDLFEEPARKNMRRALAAPLPTAVGRALPKTSRLEFRPFSMSDLEVLIDLHSDPDVMRWLTPDGRMWSQAELEARLRGFVSSQEMHGFSRWKVHRRDTGELIGRAGFAVYPPTGEIELGFSFRKSAWGQGYGSECAGALVNWLFQTDPKVDHVIAFAQPANVGSCRILEKIGMRPTHVEEIGGAPYRFYRLDWGR